MLFLLKQCYFIFFVYKKSIIIVGQKNHIVDIYPTDFSMLFQVVAQILFLAITKQFYYIFDTDGCNNILNNYFAAKKADKMYPLKEKILRY